MNLSLFRQTDLFQTNNNFSLSLIFERYSVPKQSIGVK